MAIVLKETAAYILKVDVFHLQDSGIITKKPTV